MNIPYLNVQVHDTSKANRTDELSAHTKTTRFLAPTDVSISDISLSAQTENKNGASGTHHTD